MRLFLTIEIIIESVRGIVAHMIKNTKFKRITAIVVGASFLATQGMIVAAAPDNIEEVQTERILTPEVSSDEEILAAIVAQLNGEDVNEDFGEVVAESIEICPWIGDINLSRSALEGARDLERTVRTLTRVALWLLAAGVLMLGAETLKYIRNSEKKLAVHSRSEEYYRKTFDPERRGRISNPVNLARDRIASLTGKGDEGHTIDEVLSELGEIFKGFKDAGMTIDIIRYNSEGIDCNGTAPDMTTVLNFRKSWESSASLAQVDNTQFVAGIGYRFDLRVRW